MNRTSSIKINAKPLLLGMSLGLVAIFCGPGIQGASAAEDRDQYCDERGNSCNDHESSSPRESPRSAPATDPAPTDPAPTDPETPT
jgi:hypothetical protein